MNDDQKTGLVELKTQLLSNLITSMTNSDIPINPSDAMEILRYLDKQIDCDNEFTPDDEAQKELLKAFK